MSFTCNREFKVKYEGIFNSVEAYGMDTVKMAFKSMKIEKRKNKKNGFKTPRCIMILTDDSLALRNTRSNVIIFSCKIPNISYVMSSLFDKMYIAIIVTIREETGYSSKCLIVKSQYGKSKSIISNLRDILLKRHSRLIDTTKSDLPCKNCSKIFQENNSLKIRIDELAKLIDENKLEEYLKLNKIIDLKSFPGEDKFEIKRRAVTVGENEMKNQISRKTSCPDATKIDITKDNNNNESNLIALDEIINWNNENFWNEKF